MQSPIRQGTQLIFNQTFMKSQNRIEYGQHASDVVSTFLQSNQGELLITIGVAADPSETVVGLTFLRGVKGMVNPRDL